MKILCVTCKDFKSFTSRDFTFSERTYVTADNGQGKTSIPEAVAYGLFGCTLSGSPRTDRFTRQGAKKMQVAVTFIIDGAEHTVERVQARTSELYLDGKQAKQSDVDLLVGTKERFLATFWPSYFTSLSEKDGREMVMSLIKPPAQADVVAQLDEAHQELLEHVELRNPDAVAKDLRAEIKDNESEVKRMEGNLEVLREQAARDIPKPIEWDGTKLDALKVELDSAQSDGASKLREMKVQLAGMGREYEAFKEQLKAIPQAPYSEGDACPVCAQVMDGENLEHALSHHISQVSEIQAKNAKNLAKCQELLFGATELRKQLEQLEAANTASSTDALKSQINILETEKSEAASHNAYIARLQKDASEAADHIAKVEGQIEESTAAVFRLGETIKAIGAYRAKLAEMQVAQLTQHLDHVDIELFKVTKTTGEIKDCFTVTYDGREFKSLSYSEQIRAGLEISNLFNHVLGKQYPVFIDNAESITHFTPPLCGQLITASVVAGAELIVSNDVQKEVA